MADAIETFGADHREQRASLVAEGDQLRLRHTARVAPDQVAVIGWGLFQRRQPLGGEVLLRLFAGDHVSSHANTRPGPPRLRE